MKIKINGKPAECREGQTILEALREKGHKIPTLCYYSKLNPTGSCRVCVVEIEGRPGLVPSCAFPVEEGMNILTHSPKVRRARKTIVELLLSNHPDDCLYCERNNNCELQDLAVETGVRQRRYQGTRKEFRVDSSSPSIERDPAKCILCGKCVRVCDEIQGVRAIDFVNRGFSTQVEPSFNRGLNEAPCVFCGQCVLVCPTGALREKSSLKSVWEAVNDPDKLVMFQLAPAISVSIGEEFGYEPGTELTGRVTSAIKKMGVDYVFDTCVGADLTIMEEAGELVERITSGGKLPMITSCSPGWVKFIEHFYPEFLDSLSSCRSPQEMMGSLAKTYFCEKEGVSPEKLFVVSVMPCTAKKFEVRRPEFYEGKLPWVDEVITTRELARMIKSSGIEFEKIEEGEYDPFFNLTSGAGKIFGSTGGVMEAALRTAHWLITGKNLEPIVFEPVRGLEGIKEAKVTIKGITLRLAAASGLANAAKILDDLRKDPEKYQFIEIMACPGGCIAGGGQPRPKTEDSIRKRQQALYSIDGADELRLSHENPVVKRIYDEFLEKPLGHRSHKLLHTAYTARERY